MKPKWKVTLRAWSADKDGRKATEKVYIRADDEIKAALEALKLHKGMELLKVEEAS